MLKEQHDRENYIPHNESIDLGHADTPSNNVARDINKVEIQSGATS